ncbi:MAG: hypothetical protein IJY60_05310 [Bacteroides sp.]|nr:hypothetical protein [Bacteroides sp.]
MEGSNVSTKTFDLNKALGGASIGWITEEQVVEASGFKEVKPNMYTYYSGNLQYYCDKTGKELGKGKNQLYLLEMEMPDTKGTAASRADAEGNTEEIEIDVLQPRETFACYAMMGILCGMRDALQMDTYRMGLVVSKSFDMAQLMMQEAARKRAESPDNEGTEEEEKEEIDMKPELITSTTDKLLYNLGVNLEKLAKQDKEHYNEMKTNGMKIVPKDTALKVSIDGTAKVDVAAVSVDEVPVSGSVKVSNSYLDVYVENNSLDVNVTNDSIDVNVTNDSIDVNVTNFPEGSTGDGGSGEESTTE